MTKAAQNIQKLHNRPNSRKVMMFRKNHQWFYKKSAKISDFHVDLRSDDDIQSWDPGVPDLKN